MRYRLPSKPRHTFKWISTGLFAVSVLAFAVSLVRPLSIDWPGDSFAIGSGCIGYPTAETSDPTITHLEMTENVWRPGWFAMPPIRLIPLWIPVLITLFPTIVLWVRDRQPPPGHCWGCGYNLTGNESGRCPECGTVRPSGSQ